MAAVFFRPWYHAFFMLLLHGDIDTVKQTKSLIMKVIDYDGLNNFHMEMFNEIHSYIIKVDVSF